MDVYLGGRKIKVDPAASIGKGGEADVFDLGGGAALKLFKAPDHPDYAGLPAEQDAARERIALHQRKLREFPRGLPARVVAPRELATDRRGQRVVGYAMALVGGAEVLLRYGDPSFRKGVGGAEVTAVLRDLHRTVGELHAMGVVVGDFNDLNVLVRGREAFLIDADSFQFGPFLCRVFTERFVDPLLCDPNEARPLLARPFGTASDWYAFAVMVMQTLLGVGPHGGIFKPRARSARIPPGARPLRRITVFHPEVQYPKPAIPYGVLPDDLLHELARIFEKDHRDAFPRRLLDALDWVRCPTCGVEHARAACPLCVKAPAGVVKEVTVVRGQVTCTRLFETRGAIVAAAVEEGDIHYLVHDNGEYRREDGSVVLTGDLDPRLHFTLQGATTFVGRGREVALLAPGAAPERFAVDCLGARPLFAVNRRARYFVRGGVLYRRAAARGGGRVAALAAGDERVGDVLAGQTLFWVGERFGVGFYWAGSVRVGFVLDAARAGLKDTVKLPFLAGQLTGAACSVDEERAWIFLAAQRRGRTVHQCVVVRADGAVEAAAEAEAGDGSWLGSPGGKHAALGFLFAATDAGVTRVEVQNGCLVETRSYPDTEPFVTDASSLFVGKGGLVVVDSKAIRLLRIA